MARSKKLLTQIRQAIESPLVKVLTLHSGELRREVLLAAVETIETQRCPNVTFDVIVRRWYLLDVPEPGKPTLESLFGEDFMPGVAYLPVKSVADAKQKLREISIVGTLPVSRFEEKRGKKKAGVKRRAQKT